jgi:hypothetical protein
MSLTACAQGTAPNSPSQGVVATPNGNPDQGSIAYEALLPTKAIPFTAVRTAEYAGERRTKYACEDLASGGNVLSTAIATWSSKDPLLAVDQFAAVFDREMRFDRLAGYPTGTTCSTYVESVRGPMTASNKEVTFYVLGPVDLGSRRPDVTTYGFCEKALIGLTQVGRCTAVSSSANVLCKVRVWSPTAEKSLETLRDLTPTVEEYCRPHASLEPKVS